METLKPLIIICSNTHFDDNPLGAKPLAESLADRCDVIYVDPPLSCMTAVKQPRLRSLLLSKKFSQVAPSLWRLIPVVLPGKDRPFINRLTSLLLRKKIRRAIKHSSSNKSQIMIIATAPHYRVFLRDTFNVYWMMDDYASQPELTGISSSLLTKGQHHLAQKSDVNVCVSEFLKDALASPHKTVVIHNGADSATFRYPTPAGTQDAFHSLPQNFALYVGGINKRIDMNYLHSVAQQSPLVIAGSLDYRLDAKEFDELRAMDNVTYLGTIDNKDVPGLMNKANVGLVPYADTPFNRASMPLKIPEYLLCGLHVVSPALDYTTAFETDDVYAENSYESFADRVQEILDAPPSPGQRSMRSSRIAQTWSWDHKADEFLELLNRL